MYKLKILYKIGKKESMFSEPKNDFSLYSAIFYALELNDIKIYTDNHDTVWTIIVDNKIEWQNGEFIDTFFVLKYNEIVNQIKKVRGM